jgi:hypothetical protein
MGKPMLTVDALHKADPPCAELHNYYINNYKSGQDIRHNNVVQGSPLSGGNNFFVISFSDLYDLFNLNVLDVPLMRCFAL